MGIITIYFNLFLPSPAQAVVNTVTFGAVKDSMLREDRPIKNEGANNQIEVMSRSGARNRRSVVDFNVSSIPPGSTIEWAVFRMYMQNLPAGLRTYNVHRLTNSWLEGNGDNSDNSPGVNGTTWIERQYGDNLWTGAGPWDWAARGGDWLGTITASTDTPAAAGWMYWNVIGDVGAWVSAAAPNYGWLVKDAVENSPAQYRGRFASRETAAAGQAPALDVNYLRGSGAVSTTSVEVGSYGPIKTTFTDTGGAGADQIHQVVFTIPSGWNEIPTAAGGYAVTAPAGKTWNITTVPATPDGPQNVAITAVAPTDDLVDGETIEVAFNLRAPWLSGDTSWTFSMVGAAGGTHYPADWVVGAYSGFLDFAPTGDQSLMELALSGLDSTTTGSLGPLEVRDARGTAAGWNVVLSATDFVMTGDISETISATGFAVPSVPVVTTISGNSPPISGNGSLAGAGIAILNAVGGTGMGHYQALPGLELMVPAETLDGTYSATITETLVSGL